MKAQLAKNKNSIDAASFTFRKNWRKSADGVCATTEWFLMQVITISAI